MLKQLAILCGLLLTFLCTPLTAQNPLDQDIEIDGDAYDDLAAQENSKPDLFNFGSIGEDEVVEHTFHFWNPGGETLEIQNVQLTPPLVVTSMPASVTPGAEGTVTVRLGTPRDRGDFQGKAVINFKNEGVGTLEFVVLAKTVPPIEFRPRAAFFVATKQGESKNASVEIINHEQEPLEILRVENPSTRFTTELETVEAGERYRLHLTLDGNGSAGKASDTITLVTQSEKHPFLEVKANTWIKDRVYTFPDSLEFGQISGQYLKTSPQMASYLSQTLMVYQLGGKDFQIGAQTDIPFLNLAPERSKFGDRYQIEITVIPEKLKRGPVEGSITVVTNDPEFPQLTIPVKAFVQDSW